MIKSNFIQLYKSLTKQEKKALQKWVYSPMHNQHQEVCKLFDYLARKTKITKTTVDKQRIYKELFPLAFYNDLKLRHVQSYALNVLEHFVGYNHLFLDQLFLKRKQLEVYRLRGLTKLSTKILRKSEQELAEKSLKNSDFHLEAYQLEIEKFKHGSTERRTEANNLPQLFGHLSEFFIIATLKYACTAASHSNVFKSEYDIPLLAAVLEYAKEGSSSISVKIYYEAYQSLIDADNERHYKTLRNLFFEHIALFSKEEQYELFQLTINYCIKQINTGNSKYFGEVFELYQGGLTTTILLDKNALSRFTYKNIVSAGLKLKEFEWVEAFIKEYTVYLPQKFKHTYKVYSTAKLHYSTGDYGAALQLLVQVEEYDDLFLTLDAKVLLLKIYYEEESIDALLALIASFNVFLQRKDIMGYHKQVYKNLLRLVNKFLGLPLNDKNIRSGLIAEVKKTQPLVEQQWLLDQLDEGQKKELSPKR
jgi:hypothetical protein